MLKRTPPHNSQRRARRRFRMFAPTVAVEAVNASTLRTRVRRACPAPNVSLPAVAAGRIGGGMSNIVATRIDGQWTSAQQPAADQRNMVDPNKKTGVISSRITSARSAGLLKVCRNAMLCAPVNLFTLPVHFYRLRPGCLHKIKLYSRKLVEDGEMPRLNTPLHFVLRDYTQQERVAALIRCAQHETDGTSDTIIA
jgi:hypothetical protein